MRLALSLVLAVSFFPSVVLAQTCAAAVFGDGRCDCGCGTVDSDCPAGAKFDACQVTHCAAGTVPWEHNPHTCMASACGDGWNDPASGEVCDDGNALAGGGCAANCRAVTSGYVCGEGATGCRAAPVDAGAPDAGVVVPDAGQLMTVDAGVTAAPDAGAQVPLNPMTPGCGAAGAGVPVTLALASVLAALRRARRLS